LTEHIEPAHNPTARPPQHRPPTRLIDSSANAGPLLPPLRLYGLPLSLRVPDHTPPRAPDPPPLAHDRPGLLDPLADPRPASGLLPIELIHESMAAPDGAQLRMRLLGEGAVTGSAWSSHLTRYWSSRAGPRQPRRHKQPSSTNALYYDA